MKPFVPLCLAAIAFCAGSVSAKATRDTLPPSSDSAVSARPAPEQIPMLKNKIGLGLTWGALNYIGDYPSATSVYARGTLRWNPWEWLALRAVGGGGLAWSNKAEGNLEIFDGAVSLVLQPTLRSRFRPYIASGFGLASIMIAHDFDEVDANVNDLREGMRIGYVPLELGLEYLLTEHVSLSLMAETYIAASDADLWDGVNKPGQVSSFDFDKRDEVQRVGMGITFYVDPAPDSDKDGVKNRVDRCPNTARGLIVDALGCPMDTDGDGVPDIKDRCGATPREAKADSLGCPIDTDLDGVADYQDKCPATPAGVRITTDGCPLDGDADKIPDYQDKCPNTPAGIEVDNAGCPKDADSDGVADMSDKCPNSPAGLPVDASGCSKDEDADGVADGLDKCSGTPKGTEVDSIGCQRIRIASGVKLTLQGIFFKSGKSDLVDSSRAALARAAVAIAKAPEARIEIAGHTDEKGTVQLNQALSQARAATVRTYLIALGIPSEQLVAKGYGMSQPMAPNKTEAGRALNRRIEFRVK